MVWLDLDQICHIWADMGRSQIDDDGKSGAVDDDNDKWRKSLTVNDDG